MSNIKWRDKDKKELSNLVRKFNSKITRTLKKHPDYKSYLPERLTTEKLKSLITTRQDFNRLIKKYSRFLKKGAERPILTFQGLQTTQWQVQEIIYDVANINRRRTKFLKQISNLKDYGKGTVVDYENLGKKTFNLSNIKPQDFKYFLKSLEKQTSSTYFLDKAKSYKDNYLKAILNNLGDSPEAIEFYNFVLQQEPTNFYSLAVNDPVLAIQFISDPLPVGLIIESSYSKWLEVTS